MSLPAYPNYPFSDNGGNLDAALMEAFEEELRGLEHALLHAPLRKDWHPRLFDDEPECGETQWRCKDRRQVLDIETMDNSHLLNALRFAQQKRQHRSRLQPLLAEAKRRNIRP